TTAGASIRGVGVPWTPASREAMLSRSPRLRNGFTLPSIAPAADAAASASSGRTPAIVRSISARATESWWVIRSVLQGVEGQGAARDDELGQRGVRRDGRVDPAETVAVVAGHGVHGDDAGTDLVADDHDLPRVCRRPPRQRLRL